MRSPRGVKMRWLPALCASALAKGKPLNFVAAGASGVGHLTQALFHHLAGIKGTHTVRDPQMKLD